MTGLHRWAEEQPLPGRLHWTAQYFRWCAISSVVALGISMVFMPFAIGMRAAVAAHPFRFGLSLVLVAVTSASWWWTGERLLARRRDGAWWAIGALALPLLERLGGGGGPSGVTTVISALGLLAILTSWRELE